MTSLRQMLSLAPVSRTRRPARVADVAEAGRSRAAGCMQCLVRDVVSLASALAGGGGLSRLRGLGRVVRT